jgi:hypothetical protein
MVSKRIAHAPGPVAVELISDRIDLLGPGVQGPPEDVVDAGDMQIQRSMLQV